jgi:hypothetical protein
MPTTTPKDFVDHVDDAFLRTWTLLEYLTCHIPVDSPATADLVAAAAWAHEAYTRHGQHRPSPTAKLHFPASDTTDVRSLVADLGDLLTSQLQSVGGDLEEALRLRRALDHVRQAQASECP